MTEHRAKQRRMPTLYDDGTLVATFDENDDVIDMFVNGPSGAIATYWQNNDDELHYFLKDHLGTTWVTMRADSTVSSCNAYWPFGEIEYSYGSYQNPYRFTGKERDEEGKFGFDYFGARYYNPAIGSFTTIDKASQFASGYVYGANNPTIGTDPDGNLFGIDDLIVSGVAFVTSFVSTAVTTGEFDRAFKQALVAASSAWLAYNTGGAAAGALFKEGSAMYALTASTAGGVVSGASSVPLAQYVERFRLRDIGKGDFWGSVGRSAIVGGVGGLAGGLTGQYLTSDPILSGFVGGGVGGAAQGAYNHDILSGMMFGASSGAWNAALTVGAYNEYGRLLTKSKFPDGVPDELSCHEFRKQFVKKGESYLEWKGEQALMMDGELFIQKKDIYAADGSLVAKAGPVIQTDIAHSGVALGRTLYGEHIVLSKINVNMPVVVTTARYFNSFLRQQNPAGGYFQMPSYRRVVY